MKNKKVNIFSGITVLILILAILPSFTGLSESYTLALPALASKTGPLNPLKFFAPFLLAFVVLGFFRLRDPRLRRGILVLGAAWAVGTVFTLIAASRCGFPPMFLREWASISLGLLVGVALRFLVPTLRDRVFFGWMVILFSTVALDLLFPSSIDWLYAQVFDPETRQGDVAETGTRALTGVFGRQSAAKLMSWVPWLVLPAFFRVSRRSGYIALAALGIWSGLILATSQRGPMFAAFAALLVFGIHRAACERKWKPFFITAAVICVGFLSIFITVPSTIVGPRLLNTAPVLSSGEPIANAEQILKTSEHNARYRLGMTHVSVDSIRTHPLGDACIPKSFFAERGMAEGHSHNLVLEQFRSRGWIWGLVHLALWILAGIAFLRARDLRASCSIAALAAIFVCGLVDHPWFVLNQSIVLGAVLVEGIVRFFDRNTDASNGV